MPGSSSCKLVYISGVESLEGLLIHGFLGAAISFYTFFPTLLC